MNTLTVILIAAGILAAIALLVSLAAFYCANTTYSVPKYKDKDMFYTLPGEQYDPYREQLVGMTKDALGLPCEDVYITSFDGLRLHGRYYHVSDSAPVQIMCHGYHGFALRDFCGGVKEALAAGYNALLIDQRAHWGSKGHWLTFGVNERRDAADWVKYISGRFGADKEILLYGISMGAATVLMASELELDGNVRGIIADCGYTSPEEIIRKVVKEMKLPAGIVCPLIRLGGRLFGGFDIRAVTARDAMKNCRYPVLFIHGDDDRFVPFDMSRENYELCVSEIKRRLWVPGAGHGLAYMVDKQGYLDAVNSFAAEVGALAK